MTRADCISKLLSEYQELQRENERDRDRRIEEARRADPEIARLLDENANTFEESTRRLLSDWKSAAEQSKRLKETVLRNQEKIAALLEKDGFPKDQLGKRYHCDLCRDTGYVGELRNVFCSCFEQKLNEMLLEGSGMTLLARECFEKFDETIYPDETQKTQAINARDLCRNYADTFPRGQYRNVMLMGESGLGKTFLLNCIAGRILQRGIPAVRITAFRMLEAMREHHFGQAGDRESSFERLLGCDLLLIDDLGSEPMLNNITVEYLFLLLNERTANGKATVIATNLSTSELKNRYGERVMSRLMDRANTLFIRLVGKDLRRVKRGQEA